LEIINRMENCGEEKCVANISEMLLKLGMSVREIDAELTAKLALKEDFGLIVVGTKPGREAEKGGILSGDVILEFGDFPIHTLGELERAFSSHTPGSPVGFMIRRAGVLRFLIYRFDWQS
jgi:S1-C subfamily serine protease